MTNEFWIKRNKNIDSGHECFETEICTTNRDFSDHIFEDFKDAIHVVEYSVLDQANAKIKELKAKVEKYREVLEFYANVDSYYASGRLDYRNHIIDNDLEQELIHYSNFENLEWCGGKRARQALKDVEGVG